MKKTLLIVLIAILVVASIIAVSVAMSNNTASKNSVSKPTSSETTSVSETATQVETQASTKATEDKSIETPTVEQKSSSNEVVLPELRTTWKNENNPNGCSIVINNQDGNTLDFTVTSIRGNAAQIATSNINVTLDTEYDGSLVRGYAEFEYVDSFGNGGTGSISVSENAILLVINNEFGPGVWSIANATGTYY